MIGKTNAFRERAVKLLTVLMLTLLGAIAGGLAVFLHISAGSAPDCTKVTSAQSIPHDKEVVLACPGRIEGLSEIVKVCSGMDGTLSVILVREGDQVSTGQALAIIDRPDLADEFSAASAAAESARQSRAHIRRGSRQQERDAAAADTAAANATWKQAQVHFQRIQQLFEKGVVSAEARDEAQKELDVAAAKLEAVAAHQNLTDEGPLPEELAKADADVNVAEQRVRTARDS